MSDTWDWGDEIVLSDEDKIQILDPGEYDYKIEKLEKGRTKDGGKMAILHVRIEDPLTPMTVKDYIPLKNTLRWKWISILESTGLKKAGEQVRLKYDELIGKTGRCEIFIDEYTSNSGGKFKSNKISSYLPPEGEFDLF